MTPEWEDVGDLYPSSATDRLKVPGGWLYRTIIFSPLDKSDIPITTDSVATVFVPDAEATQ